MNKNYIILRIIYKRVENAKIGALSYGYLMDMLWISFGKGTIREGKGVGNAAKTNRPYIVDALKRDTVNETKSPIYGRCLEEE